MLYRLYTHTLMLVVVPASARPMPMHFKLQTCKLATNAVENTRACLQFYKC